VLNHNAIRGMNDCLPKDSHLWLSLEKIIFDTFIAYGFKNIRTPVVEKTDTFCRAIGQTTDIVEQVGKTCHFANHPYLCKSFCDLLINNTVWHMCFLKSLHNIQSSFPEEDNPIRTALVTARGAPAHKRHKYE
jgi:hypothetical protein